MRIGESNYEFIGIPTKSIYYPKIGGKSTFKFAS